MKTTTRIFWDRLLQNCQKFSTEKDKLILDESKFDAYEKQCDDTYAVIKNSAMKSEVEHLDRHKIAAILVIEAINLNIVIREDGKCADTEEDFFIGPQKVLLISALHYLAHQINYILDNDNKKLPKMTQFLLPTAFSCDTTYLDILSRLIRNETQNNSLYVMTLAEKFFLLEYISLHHFYGEKLVNRVIGVLKAAT